MPPSLLSQPSIAIRNTPSIAFAPRRTNKTTIRKTPAKAIKGSHRFPILVFVPIYSAATAESFKAAANPIIKAKKENNPTIRPLRKPLKAAHTNKMKAMISMNIFAILSTALLLLRK